jgi:hypothetical protein
MKQTILDAGLAVVIGVALALLALQFFGVLFF